MSTIRRKIDLYILSLGLLFVFFIIITVRFPSESSQESNFYFWKSLVLINLLPIFFIISLFYCFYVYIRFNYDLKGASEIPFKITKIKNINYEHLTFLSTYVVPLVSFNFGGERQVVVIFMLLIVIGFIYIKTDLFYANPSLALLGFHIYKVDGSFKFGNENEIVVICRGRLKIDQFVSYIKLDEKIYYVMRG